MTWYEAYKLLDEIKHAIVLANDEGDSFRVDYLKYCRKQITVKLQEFKNSH